MLLGEVRYPCLPIKTQRWRRQSLAVTSRSAAFHTLANKVHLADRHRASMANPAIADLTSFHHKRNHPPLPLTMPYRNRRLQLWRHANNAVAIICRWQVEPRKLPIPRQIPGGVHPTRWLLHSLNAAGVHASLWGTEAVNNVLDVRRCMRPLRNLRSRFAGIL